jgi:hypothetical protein
MANGNGKNITPVKWLTCILALVAVVLAALILNKVNKKCSKDTYTRPRKVGDIGPSAGGERVNPPSDFVSGCQAAFDSGCASRGVTVNVCGGYDSNNKMQIGCQDYTDMNDTSCYNSNYVAYQRSDCSKPYTWTSGYLCGGGSGDPSSNPCPSLSNNVLGPAPNNPYGCTNICQ